MNVPDACPLCRAPTPSGCSRTHTEGGVTYTLYGCPSCFVEFWWPLKNPGPEWYSHDTRYAGRNADPSWGATWNQKKIVSYLAPFRGRVLDVGCGIGNFLAYAAQNGWQCVGIDFDRDAINAGKQQFGLADMEVNDIVTYARTHADERFDMVTFFDVLEHVDNHNEFIDAVRNMLKPGGYIAMSMPYRKHAEWLMPLDVPPRHLTRWDRASLKRFLKACGFKVVYMARRTEGVWPIIMKLRFKYGKQLSFGAVSAVRSRVNDADGVRACRTLVVRAVHILAKLKDAVLFGVPAVLIWLVMLPSSRRYVTLFAIAQKADS